MHDIPVAFPFLFPSSFHNLQEFQKIALHEIPIAVHVLIPSSFHNLQEFQKIALHDFPVAVYTFARVLIPYSFHDTLQRFQPDSEAAADVHSG